MDYGSNVVNLLQNFVGMKRVLLYFALVGLIAFLSLTFWGGGMFYSGFAGGLTLAMFGAFFGLNLLKRELEYGEGMRKIVFGMLGQLHDNKDEVLELFVFAQAVAIMRSNAKLYAGSFDEVSDAVTFRLMGYIAAMKAQEWSEFTKMRPISATYAKAGLQLKELEELQNVINRNSASIKPKEHIFQDASRAIDQ